MITKLNRQWLAVVVLALWAQDLLGSVREQTVSLTVLGKPLTVRVFLPPDYIEGRPARYPSLYINDGQDAEAVALTETLDRLNRDKRMAPVIVVAVPMLPDRMGSYGFSDRQAAVSLPAATRFGPVGDHAHAYSEWLALELVPEIDRRYQTIRKPGARAILGWSLGAANAFNIGWNYPEVIGRVGGFSPSFWLSAVSGDAGTAIAPSLIGQKPMPRRFALWLAAGTAEETDDRDGDGIIDVLDDAQAVIDALASKAMKAGHAKTDLDLCLVPFPAGRHDQATWKRMLPAFLLWAYPVQTKKAGT